MSDNMSQEAMDGDLTALQPTYLGPSWARDDEGFYLLPELTLGWEIAGWCSEYILAPDTDADNPQPWRFTNEQLRLILWWYAVDETGAFVHRQGVIQRLKGWGKDPLLAVICLVELCGPSRFSHWDEATGDPVGKAHHASWVQVAAVSKSQTKNTFELFPRLMSEAFKEEFQVEPGKELIRARSGRAQLEAVTSSYRSLEGGRATFVLGNETQHWVSGNQGHKMYETISSNVTKGGNRALFITNAYLPGEDSVAEQMRRAYTDVLEGRASEEAAADAGWLYDSIEANPKSPLTREGIFATIPLIRGDAVWLDPRAIVAEIMKSNVSPARSRRMWFNQIVAAEDALFEESDWDDLGVEDEGLQPGDEIVLGFDGGKSDDATALIAIRVRDGFVQPLLIEEKPLTSRQTRREKANSNETETYWEVDREKVDSVVRSAFRIYSVQGMYADVALWDSYLVNWGAQYGQELKVRSPFSKNGNPIMWDMRDGGHGISRVTSANEILMAAIQDAQIFHNYRSSGLSESQTQLNLTLRRHVLNTRRRENGYGVSFQKESADSPNKVDAYAALMLAYQCLVDLRQKVGIKRPGAHRAWFF